MSCANETGCLTLIWKIENFSIVFSKGATVPGSNIRLPALKVDTTDGVDWCMVEARVRGDDFQLHPIASNNAYECPFEICEVSVVCSNGEVQLENKKWSFKKNLVLGDNRQPMLPQDTLTLCLRMRKEKITNTEHRILTILYQESFYWNICDVDFSQFPSCTKYFDIHNLNFRAILDKNSKCMYRITIEGIPNTRGFPTICKCKFSIKDKTNSRNYIHCNGDHYSYNTKCFQNIKVPARCSIINSFDIKINCILAVHEKLEVINDSLKTLNSDLWRMYNENIYSDATLKVKKKTYRVHRNILAARSRVFRTMFEKEQKKVQMTEAHSGIVTIKDIDNKTLELLLAFMYGDAVGDLKWEEAYSLYSAADKYAIQPLKEKCFCMLKQRLTISTVCEALVLATSHSDEKLKNFVVDFICECAIEDLKWEEASTLYNLVDKYATQPLKEKFFGMLKQRITKNNVCEALILANSHSDEKLMRFVVDFICALKDLKWEEASALYYTVDQYAIQPLKEKCFGMLKQHLTVSNVCEALVLADAHSDEKLMRFVIDFICDNKEVVSSKEWKLLQKRSPRLTSEIASELFLKKV